MVQLWVASGSVAFFARSNETGPERVLPELTAGEASLRLCS